MISQKLTGCTHPVILKNAMLRAFIQYPEINKEGLDPGYFSRTQNSRMTEGKTSADEIFPF
jgi:hypothetical protein